MSTVLEQVVTAQELLALPETHGQRELVRGELIETMPPGGVHGAIAVRLAVRLQLWADQTQAGYVGVEAGYVLERDPDTVRGPDVSYVRGERLPGDEIPEGFWELVPDLAVEVVSPSETADEVRAKVSDFLQAGTPLVWTIYPRAREVVVHTPDGLARTYTREMSLEFPGVLPGFVCTVADLFDITA
jgi:Uma2 family endonuclease